MCLLLPTAAGADTTRRRSVVVLEQNVIIRAFIADTIRRHHDVVETADATGIVALVAGGARVDVVVGCFILRETGALKACAGVVQGLYEHCPWLPVVLVSDTVPARLKADVRLTGVQAFVPSDFEPVALAGTYGPAGASA